MQNVHRVFPIRLIQGNGLGNDLLLFLKGFVGNAAAPAGDRLYRHPQQHCQHRRRGSGVADAHLPYSQSIRRGIHGQLGTDENGFLRLLPGHGRTLGNVLGPKGNFPVQHRRFPNDGVDTHIADGDPGSKVLTQHGGAGFGPGQVNGLHQRHGLGGTGYPLLYHTVVGGEDQQMGLIHGVLDFSCDPGQLNGQVLQPPQASGGLGQGILPPAGSLHGGLIQRLDPGYQFFQSHISSSNSPFCRSHSISTAPFVTSSVKLASSPCAWRRTSSIGMFPCPREEWVSALESLL